MEMKLKLKYRTGFTAPKHGYRTRTGPNCCSVNCASTRKKSKKVHGKARMAGASAVRLNLGGK